MKIVFAIPVHEKREIIQNQLDNIRAFCPNSSVVLFRSGHDPNLCDGFGVPVCPTSFPLEWAKTHSWFFLNVMEWLEDIGYEYDYLINLDSDSLFAKKGFEAFIESEMQGYDFMANNITICPNEWWAPNFTMRNLWHYWQPIFNMDHFYGCFGSQVFSRSYVKQILAFEKLEDMKKLMVETKDQMFALEEMLFVTLAYSLNVKVKRLPRYVGKYIRNVPSYTDVELKEAINKGEYCYLLHPVTRSLDDSARKFITSLID